MAVIAAGAAVTLLTGLLPGPAALLIAGSVLAGAVRGVFTLTEATLVADHWGPDRYAALNGVFSARLAATTAVGAALAVTVPSPAGPHNPGAGSGDSDQARREPPDPLG